MNEPTITQDLLAEYQGLADLCATLSPDQWHQPTAFYGWSAWDEVAHLLYFDQTSLTSITKPERFAREAKALSTRMAAGEAISGVARTAFREGDGAHPSPGADVAKSGEPALRLISGPALLTRWRSTFEELVSRLAALDPKARLAWYGPPMSARSFATARLMETWAHGQDVWDVLRRRRPSSARLKHIAHLGVGTFAWTFVNRKLPVPQAQPYVALQAPDGSTWAWGDEASEHRVSGSAQDFCLLVTQRRHLQDTQLRYSAGPVAQWLHMAQCFAGPPADGPAAGVRKVSYDDETDIQAKGPQA